MTNKQTMSQKKPEITVPWEFRQRICDLEWELELAKTENGYLEEDLSKARDKEKNMTQKIRELKDQVRKAEDDKQAQMKNVEAKMQEKFESLGNEQRKEIANLQTAVVESENQLATAKNEIMQKAHEIVTLQDNEKVLSQQNKSLRDELAHLRSVTKHKKEEIGNLTQKILKLEDQIREAEVDKQAQVEYVEAKMQAKIQTMTSALHDLQEKADSLLHQNNRLVAERAQVESLGDEQRKENAKLQRAVVESENQLATAKNEILQKAHEIVTLQDNQKVLSQQNKSLTDQLAHLRSVTEHNHEEIGNLTQKILKLEDQVREAEVDKQAQVEYVEAKMQAKIQTMTSALHDLQEKTDSRAVVESENQLATAKNALIKKEDEIKKQKMILAYKQEVINDLNKDNKSMRQIAQELKDQDQEEKILSEEREMEEMEGGSCCKPAS